MEQATALRDYRAEFDRNDTRLRASLSHKKLRNDNGEIAWGDSYLLIAYIDMYHATRNPQYLRHLVEHFDRILQVRDDMTGRKDEYAGKALAGWGSTRYSKGKWHVWIVHTGMITMGPAEFVRLVHKNRQLQKEFGAKAAEYLERLKECIRDAEPYWRNGPRSDEGYYTDPAPEIGLLPLNQQNALGCTLLELYLATGERSYRDKVERLARFFRRRLRELQPTTFDWAYWPKAHEDGPGSEDISHASINVDFAARCAAAKIVFTRQDIARFARTWLHQVRRPDGSWAGTVGGKGEGKDYMPYSIGYWLSLCTLLSKELRAEFYADAVRAYQEEKPWGFGDMLSIARLARYGAEQRAKASVEPNGG